MNQVLGGTSLSPASTQPGQPRSGAVSTPWDWRWHLKAELARILDSLAWHLQRQRQRGRTPAGDAVRGLVIEEGEANGLVAELAGDLTGNRARPSTPGMRQEVETRAEQAIAAGAFLPLRHARKTFELEPAEYDALVLALAVEIDPRFGRLVAFLNDHVARTRPTLGLVLALAGEESGRLAWPLGIEARPFLRDGLLELEGDGPLSGLAVRLPRRLVPRFAGDGATPADEPGIEVRRGEQDLLKRLVLEDMTRERLSAWGENLRARRRVPPLVLVGPEGSGRATAARAALFAAGVVAVDVEVPSDVMGERMRAARREARWHRAALVIRPHPATGAAQLDWRGLWQAGAEDRPLALLLEVDQLGGAIAASPRAPAVVFLDQPDVPLRTRLWQALLPQGTRLEESELSELVARFAFGPGRIARSVARAVADLSLRPAGERLGYAALRDAARAVDSASIGPLAQKLPLPYERPELVVPAHVNEELDLAVAWVRQRHRVLHDWGFVRRVPMGHGLTALFAGPSGTGKTMAAQVLARELGLDLHRIDASQLVSKWVGETEKNIAMAFGARVGVLFFDEADALFGKRGEAKSPQDRWANIEVGYLLQRMEEYDGVTILATNRMQDMDDAFLRRLHVVVDFPMPSEPDRHRIWQGMFPAAADRAEDIDLAVLAREFEISGGEIKNAMLAAAYMAAAEARPIGMEHLRRAATRELVKSGKVVEG